MNETLAYLFLKLQGMALLVLNRKAAALERFDAMLALRPADFYALASRAHVLAQLGRKVEALAAQEQLGSITRGLQSILPQRAARKDAGT